MDNYGLVKDLLLWWLYVDFLSVGSVGIKKLSSLLLLSLYSGLVLSYGVVSRLAWLRRWLLYDSGCCLDFRFYSVLYLCFGYY
jgi:hypothetical protein